MVRILSSGGEDQKQSMRPNPKQEKLPLSEHTIVSYMFFIAQDTHPRFQMTNR